MPSDDRVHRKHHCHRCGLMTGFKQNKPGNGNCKKSGQKLINLCPKKQNESPAGIKSTILHFELVSN